MLTKITKKITSDIISDSYTGISSEDKLFIQIKTEKMLDQYKEEAKVHCLFD